MPLHPTTRAALRSYAERRDAHLGSRCSTVYSDAEIDALLAAALALPPEDGLRVFWRLSREIGLRRPGDRTGPRVHDCYPNSRIDELLPWAYPPPSNHSRRGLKTALLP